ncbi:thiamine pyrophosphate-dependent enzyme, partial [Streptomyces sp. L7]
MALPDPRASTAWPGAVASTRSPCSGLFRGNLPLGGWDPYAHHFNLYTLVIGAQTLHAVGYAMGLHRDDDTGRAIPTATSAVLAFLGDGALSEGETNEAFVWAAAQNLPVVFFCQNNQWAISAPYSVQSRIPAAQRAAGYGFPGIRVDGNDVLACLAATRLALDRARSGNGPTLIEAVTYRVNAHTTADDATRYRPAAETEDWAARTRWSGWRPICAPAGAVTDDHFTDVEQRVNETSPRRTPVAASWPSPTRPPLSSTPMRGCPPDLLQQLRASGLEFVSTGPQDGERSERFHGECARAKA